MKLLWHVCDERITQIQIFAKSTHIVQIHLDIEGGGGGGAGRPAGVLSSLIKISILSKNFE